MIFTLIIAGLLAFNTFLVMWIGFNHEANMGHFSSMKEEIRTLKYRMKHIEDQYRKFANSMKMAEREVYLETFSDEHTTPTATVDLSQMTTSRKIRDSFFDDTEFDSDFDS